MVAFSVCDYMTSLDACHHGNMMLPSMTPPVRRLSTSTVVTTALLCRELRGLQQCQ
jgi:hypothetical protein